MFRKKRSFVFFLFFISGVLVGYFWHFFVFKKYEVNEKNCYDYIVQNKYLYNRSQELVLDELFSNAKKKGDVFIFYTEDGKGFKIRRIK